MKSLVTRGMPSSPRARTLALVVCLVLFAWTIRIVTPRYDGCEGGCVTREKIKEGNVIEPFNGADEDLTNIDEDDDDDMEGNSIEDTEQRAEAKKEDREATNELIKKDLKDFEAIEGVKKTDKSVDAAVEENKKDDHEIDESKEDDDTTVINKFVPITEGTLGLQIMQYKSELTKVSQIKMDLYQPKDLPNEEIALDSGTHVITTFFHGTYHDKRFKELMATLVSNIENPEITAMHVLWQGADPRMFIPDDIAEQLVQRGLHRKLILTEVDRQPTYKAMFGYANEHLKRGSIAIVTNADIYFDTSLKCVTLPPKNYTTLYYHPERVKSGRIAFALSRRHSALCKNKKDHHSIFDLCEEYTLSHDAFVFAPPIPKSIVQRTDHTQNQGYGAENIVIFEFKREKYNVINPCFTVKGFHLHCVNERHYVANFVNRNPPRPGSSYPARKKCGIWVY